MKLYFLSPFSFVECYNFSTRLDKFDEICYNYFAALKLCSVKTSKRKSAPSLPVYYLYITI